MTNTTGKISPIVIPVLILSPAIWVTLPTIAGPMLPPKSPAIARSANTGISAFINQRGNIVEKSEWWTEDCLAMQLPLSNRITVFVQYGDIIGRICKFLSILMLLLLAVRLVMYKKAV